MSRPRDSAGEADGHHTTSPLLDRLPLAGTLRNVLPEVTHQMPSPRPKRSICVLDDDPSTSAEAPIWCYHRGATGSTFRRR
jgi:hypothetical protein